MGYYTRVLTRRSSCPTLSELARALSEEHPSAKLAVEEGDDGDWAELLLTHRDGTEIAAIERSNEDGYHILWQFSDTVEGSWSMAVLRDNDWVKFEMDLGSPAHRKSFLEGHVPPGAKLA